MRYVITAVGRELEFTREITAYGDASAQVQALVDALARMGASVTVEAFPLYV
jgi:hypothetical protein